MEALRRDDGRQAGDELLVQVLVSWGVPAMLLACGVAASTQGGEGILSKKKVPHKTKDAEGEIRVII